MGKSPSVFPKSPLHTGSESEGEIPLISSLTTGAGGAGLIVEGSAIDVLSDASKLKALEGTGSKNFPMSKKPALKDIDPRAIFLHGNGFFLAGELLSSFDMNKNPQLAAEIGQAAMVLSALTSEVFFKCLICIETGLVPSGHDLDYLFKRLSASSRAEIEQIWNSEVVPLRNAMWI
jgi:hypothetical protein